ncbi:MAG: hypothetical protein CM15mP102_00460 [Flavobacteriales bacterium]|nr:MAG: hypothetical protein CM15mP102_00460 [Flavobacteriales bacterium]
MSIPEIADDFYQIDDAIRTGYAWSYGPFEIWDNLGINEAVEMIKSCGEELPSWITDMVDSGAKSFYVFEDGKKKFYDINTKKYKTVPSSENHYILDAFRKINKFLKTQSVLFMILVMV